MTDRGKGIMVLPEGRTAELKVTASKRRQKVVKAQLAPVLRRFKRGAKAPPSPVIVESENSDKELSREIQAEFEENYSDDNRGEEEVAGDEEGDSLFLLNQNSDSSMTKKVIRDSRGRFIRCSEGSSAVVRSKTKRDFSWRLPSRVVGGPSQCYVLRSFGGHVAFNSWSAPESLRSWIKCYERQGLAEQFATLKLSGRVADRVRETGLGHLKHCMSSNIDENLISAFVERWQPDTNTFHMPFGEITILLHDVFFLLDIPVDGDLVRVKGDSVEDDEAEGSKVEDETMKAKLAVFLGVDMETIQPPVYKGGGVSVQMLKTVVESGNQHDAFRAYMMLLLGQTLFMDKSGDRVIAQMLGLFDDLSVVDDYAWGAATLANLYRQLGMASRGGARGVAGCLSLLQAWIYEYFPDFRPHGGYYLEGRPRAEAWSHVPRCKGNCTLLEQRRQTLDGLRAERVAWTPFGIRPDRQCRKTQYFGLIRFLNILEPYQPDRCMRQFGLVQTQPSPMITPASDYRPTDLPRAGYRVQYGEYADFQWADEFSNIRLVDRTTCAVLPFQVDKKYMAWYKTISHRYLYPPTHRVQFARRREIWDEPEVSRAIARMFSLAFKQPTVEAKKKYVWSLVKKLEPFYTVGPEDDGNEKAAHADTDVEVEGTSC